MFHVPFDEDPSDCTGTRELFKCNRTSDRRRTRKLELEIRNSLIRLSRLIVALRDEMSLLPVRATHQSNSRSSHAIPPLQKPMIQYRNAISSMQAMLDIMAGIRKIRECIPVREAVSGVLSDRREFVRRCTSFDSISEFLIHEVTPT